jgi:3'-phosphoadenosine 5'-phosphosulfate sulfotransferase (PAPS reductase)/FAD synthetase
MKNIISYGGGTQSTAMILMALEGKFNLPRPDFAVWADTGGEPGFIYDYVDYFIQEVKQTYDFDIFKIKHKEGIVNNLLKDPKTSRMGNFYTSSVPPFYTLSAEGKKGMLNRQCTSDFKINPIKTFINSKVSRGERYKMLIGISFDERSRMRISNYKKRVNVYPLVDNFIRRQDSIDYVTSLGFRSPQRSSCFFCPFHSNEYWQWLKDYHFNTFQNACDLELAIQQNGIQWKTNQGNILIVQFTFILHVNPYLK